MTLTDRQPPSGVDVRRLQQELQSTWQTAFTRDQSMRDLVNLKNPVELLPITDDLNIEPIELHSGRSGAILDHAQSFVITIPSVHIEPRDLTTETRRETEQSERALMSIFMQQLVATGFWSHLGRGSLLTGRGVLVALPLPAAWTAAEGFPIRQPGQKGQDYINEVNDWKRESGKTPITLQSVPADDILLKLDSNDKAILALEQKMVSAEMVANQLGSAEVAELLNTGRLKWYDQLPVLQYIDDTFVCYYLTSVTPIKPGAYQPYRPYKRLKSWAHGLGRCPVVFIPGIRTDEKDYELRFKPLLTDAKEDLEIYDFLLSRLATMVKAFYFPSYEWQLGRPSSEFSGQDRPEEQINIGGTSVTYSDENLRPLGLPNNLPDASFLSAELDSQIQRNALEDVLFGRTSGSSAAFAIRLRINVAKNKLVPYVTHMAIGLTEAFDIVTRAVEQLGETLIIDGEEFTVAMAKAARGRISISVDPRLPGEEGIDLQKAQMATELKLPEPWIWEHILGISDPGTLALLRDVLALEDLPEVRERILKEAMEELQIKIEDTETLAILDALEQYGDRIDPAVIATLQGMLTGNPAPEDGTAPPPPPSGGLGTGPFPPGASNVAVGGGRGLGTAKTPRPANQFTQEDAAAAGTLE